METQIRAQEYNNNTTSTTSSNNNNNICEFKINFDGAGGGVVVVGGGEDGGEQREGGEVMLPFHSLGSLLRLTGDASGGDDGDKVAFAKESNLEAMQPCVRVCSPGLEPLPPMYRVGRK